MFGFESMSLVEFVPASDFTAGKTHSPRMEKPRSDGRNSRPWLRASVLDRCCPYRPVLSKLRPP